MTLLYILLSLFLSTTVPPKEHARVKIAVVYYNQVDRELKKQLLSNIITTYNSTVTEINGTRPLPINAYYKPRGRYRADGLLIDLATIPGFDKVIGITSRDISTTKDKIYDWGIMGLGTRPGKSCVISTYRIKTTNKALFNDRFIKIGLHELGHTFGLPHCTYSSSCFMESAEGTIKSVDREDRLLCSHCSKLLASLTQR